MPSTDWLLMLNRDGVVEAVDGGAPAGWVARRVEDCAGLPEAVKSAARRLVRDVAQPLAGTLVRRERVDPEAPGAPSFTLIAVEAIPIRPAEVSLAPLIRRALEPLSQQAAAENVSLELELADEAKLAASIDADKIAWALSALVGNALRYVRRGDGALPGGNIRVRAGHNAPQRMMNVTVQDDGPGIPASVRPWLLTPHPETGRTAGVGLRLVHDIVAAHGGGMVIKSSAEPRERGTTVTLWLPARD
jgi:two-component system sensor histidine kinase QseC